MDKSLRSSSIPIGPPDSTTTGSVSQPGTEPEIDPDPLCATCGYLRWLYGDDDPELIAHIDTHYHDIDAIIADLNNNSPAN